MIVIPERRLVVLLPWKCASQTLRSRLRAHDARSFHAFFHLNTHLGRIAHHHLTLRDFRALPESDLGYRVAVFVRNPYDRVYSGFLQLRRDVVWQRQAQFLDSAVRAKVMRQLDLIEGDIHEAGGSASRWFSKLDENVVLRDGMNTSIPIHPCHFWTHERGMPAVAFLGRVENFEADFKRLQDQFDLRDATQDRSNVSRLSRDNLESSPYRHAAKFAPDARARIERLYADDFTYFGYAPMGAAAFAGVHR